MESVVKPEDKILNVFHKAIDFLLRTHQHPQHAEEAEQIKKELEKTVQEVKSGA